MKFHTLLQERPFSLVVSLPENRLDLAEAALEGGADALKVHANVWHRASDHTFGSLDDNLSFLDALIRLAGDVPIGLVPGGAEAFASVEEMEGLAERGLDFYSAYACHLPAALLNIEHYSKMVALDSEDSCDVLEGLIAAGADVIECSIQPGTNYGQKLTARDVALYGALAVKASVPLLVPTQKAIQPDEVNLLQRVGVKALMIGAIVTGAEPEPALFRLRVAEYAAAVARCVSEA